MLWLKALHVMFVIAWFAGLLYLPRLFVYHCGTEDTAGKERFKIMDRKLFAIMTIGGIGAIVFGTWLLGAYAQAYAGTAWLPVKLTLVASLIVFHIYCGWQVRVFSADRNQRSARFFRLINEIPALMMVAIVILVVVKPF
jgi:putative membrane protein